MEISEAIDIAEGIKEPKDHDHWVNAWQLLINTGVCWDLQGWFGRRAMELIENQVCYEASQR